MPLVLPICVNKVRPSHKKSYVIIIMTRSPSVISVSKIFVTANSIPEILIEQEPMEKYSAIGECKIGMNVRINQLLQREVE